MKISLPPGTLLQGIKHKYIVENTICFSDRSVTVFCKSEDGKKWRLKFYNGSSSVTEDIQKKILSIPMKGVVLPQDIGEFAGKRFSVFPIFAVTSIDSCMTTVGFLTKTIIPQLTAIIEEYHKKRIIVRDVCPEHILYSSKSQQIAFCGFNNAVELQGNATATKCPGFGQHFIYLAPEIEQYGYSFSSDYFSLGMTLLSIVKHIDTSVFKNRTEFVQNLCRGNVPGIDMAYLKNVTYEQYSEEDRVLYLVLGLLVPDPRKRWGYNEIQCWLHGQHIPIISREKRTHYQFVEPCIVGHTKCWNEFDLANALARDKGAWNEATLKKVLHFAEQHRLKCRDVFREFVNDSAISTKGKIFRFIYSLNPSMDGLWWDATYYPDMRNLINDADSSTSSFNMMAQLLRDGCLSYFCRVRNQLSRSCQYNISELIQMEQCERAESGKGVYRCIMRYAHNTNSRFFQVNGFRYRNVLQLLEHYQKRGNQLKRLSRTILTDGRFQAWLWANGMEQPGIRAKEMVEQYPERSFYLLLSICEAQAREDKTRQMARELFLHWGDFAPIVWLANNIHSYKVISPSHEDLFDVFANIKFQTNNTLEVLHQKAQSLLIDYQTFVGRTIEDASILKKGDEEIYKYGYYPTKSDGYFCHNWDNGLEVSKAFLKYVG